MDIFSRYGSFVGFFPLYDPRAQFPAVLKNGGLLSPVQTGSFQ